MPWNRFLGSLKAPKNSCSGAELSEERKPEHCDGADGKPVDITWYSGCLPGLHRLQRQSEPFLCGVAPV